MNTIGFFDDLIQALRAELQEYGGLIALFDEQQSTILRGDPDGFLNLGSAVHDQVTLLGAHRAQREDLVRGLARNGGRSETTKLTELLDMVPAGIGGMIKALIDEINTLVTRTQRRLRQNQLLLARCVGAAQELAVMVGGNEVVSTYGRSGVVHRGLSQSFPSMAVA